MMAQPGERTSLHRNSNGELDLWGRHSEPDDAALEEFTATSGVGNLQDCQNPGAKGGEEAQKLDRASRTARQLGLDVKKGEAARPGGDRPALYKTKNKEPDPVKSILQVEEHDVQVQHVVGRNRREGRTLTLNIDSITHDDIYKYKKGGIYKESPRQRHK
jgi:hypothetical protein